MSGPTIMTGIPGTGIPGLEDLAERLPRLAGKRARHALLIGDDGVLLARLSGRALAEIWFCPQDRAEDGQALFGQLLGSNRHSSLAVYADVLEQMYREDRLPKLGMLDAAKIQRRRLDMAFPGDDIKAALKLGRVPGGGSRVLMAVLPRSKAVAAWAGWLEGLANPVGGFTLLPLEAAGLAEALLPKTDASGRRWRLLIAQQANGGMRQIVTVDGQLAITRMTQSLWAEDREDAAILLDREVRSTISYLKRLGIAADEQLEACVIGDEALCREVQAFGLPVAALTVMTPQQAAKGLGLAVGGQGDVFADPLLLAWALRGKKPRLLLPTPAQSAAQLRLQSLRGARALALVGTALAALYVGSVVQDYLGLETEAEELTAKLAGLKRPGGDRQAEPGALALPAADLRTASRIAEAWGRSPLDVAALLAQIPAEPAPLKVTLAQLAVDGKAPLEQAPAAWELSLTYDLGGKLTLEAQYRRMQELRQAVALAFPGAKVSVSRLPAALQPSQPIEGRLGSGETAPATEAQMVLLVRKEG